MMFKDEVDLLIPWCLYYGHLFGFENLYVWDNGSTAPAIPAILERFESRGVKINRSCTTSNDFHQKGVHVRRAVHELEHDDYYDFFMPLDCDEFLCLRPASTNEVICEKTTILASLEALFRPAVYKVEYSYPNLPNVPGQFVGSPHSKRFFSPGTLNYLDHGFHSVIAHEGIPTIETEFAHIHYHYKPLFILKQHTRHKIAPYFDPSKGIEQIPKDHRIGKYLHMTESEYDAGFEHMSAYKHYSAPSLRETLRLYGGEPPFSSNSWESN